MFKFFLISLEYFRRLFCFSAKGVAEIKHKQREWDEFVQCEKRVNIIKKINQSLVVRHLVIPRVAIRYLNPWPHNDTFFRLSTS